MEFEQAMSLFNDNSWRSRVSSGKGSFRGVPFFIMDDGTISGGRRLVRHEYPMRDDGEIEDMGLSTREYAFTAIVFGDDYLDQKDALISALEANESGEIDHPYYGKEQIQIETYTVRESCYTGGVAMFSVTFVLATENTSPIVTSESTLNSDTLTDSTLADITDTYGTFSDKINNAIDRMNAIENTVNTVVNGIRSLPAGSGMNQLLGAALGLKGSLKNLLNAPGELFGSLSDLISGMVDVAPADAASRALRKTSSALQSQSTSNVPAVAEFQRVINTTTDVFLTRELAVLTLDAAGASVREQQLAPKLTQAPNVQGITPLLPTSTHVDATQVAIPLIETVGDVLQNSHELDESLTQLIVNTGDLGWFKTSEQLRDFRIVFLQQMQTTSTRLPTARTVKLIDTEPALVTLYRETQSVAQIDRFIRRNGIRHPAFVTGALSVEVIGG
ncbi:DNA circularization N-terminal domain-containing protein [Providencia rettgeri]|uniref:DNA circularization protein n=1 Tax=Providencia rettgeri TaxID=587 RepID=UPI001CFD12E9|nr:DNA circularization N-terminal domain-containing protein [Providencia rettgeri]MCB4853517.1 DNA circularization N-terminal domain-containing protein [Providencia rettgeri]MCD6314084.1 DNA circularization N-terminal domain-containing protein [Providencia rettgeri]